MFSLWRSKSESLIIDGRFSVTVMDVRAASVTLCIDDIQSPGNSQIVELDVSDNDARSDDPSAFEFELAAVGDQTADTE